MLDVREAFEDPLDWSLYFGGNFTFAIVDPRCGDEAAAGPR